MEETHKLKNRNWQIWEEYKNKYFARDSKKFIFSHKDANKIVDKETARPIEKDDKSTYTKKNLQIKWLN